MDMITTPTSPSFVSESLPPATQNTFTEAPSPSRLWPSSSPVVPRTAGSPRRKHRVRWWIGRGILIVLLVLGIASALPASRNYLIDLVLYQGGDLFSTGEARTVERVVHVPWG